MGSAISRRSWIRKSGMVLPGIFFKNFQGTVHSLFKKSNLTILIISGWQDINIGDIAHTPGLLHIIETFLPEARVILWKKSDGSEVDVLLQRNFSGVKIIHGEVKSNGEIENKEVKSAFEQSDLMIHGSGPSIVGKVNLEAWYKYTGKPFGIFGTTIQNIDSSLAELLKKALFIYTRETASLKVLHEAGIKVKNQFFVPDATFYFNLRNDTKASAFLNDRQLEDNKFICVVPRLRRTPYYKIRPGSYTQEQIREIDDLNNSKKEADHYKMREAMITWVRKTQNKVLVCPEMTYQVDIMDELLINPLPDDVRSHVLKRGYWYPDEAASVYSRAFAVISFECHSPIISLTNNTPAFYLRQPEDTIKGQMYYDLGLRDWIFEIEETTGKQISERLMGIYLNPDAAVRKMITVTGGIDSYYSKGIESINNGL